MTAAVIKHVDKAGLIESVGLLQEALDTAGVVIFPTETVYGLAARADMIGAVDRIFDLKERPRAKPLPVMIRSMEAAYSLAEEIDERFVLLAECFWPGPLTIVLHKNTVIDPIVTSGLRTVALRVPNHEVALRLLNYLPLPLAVTSANISDNEVTSDEELVEQFGDKVDVIILGETMRYPRPSTVIDLTTPFATILREGAIERERITGVLHGHCELR